ncbi:MAG: hypothetical protein ABIT04_00880 [Novosphingobium sp.]
MTISPGAGGNSSTNVDASTNSRYRAIFIPPVVPGTPPSTVGVGNIVKETGACGPLQRVVREPVQGTFFGLFKNSRVGLGYNEYLAPYIDEQGVRQDYRRVPLEDGSGYRLFGHQVTQMTTVLGVAGARNIALGGGGGGGAWGQGGMGASSSMQELVTSLQLRDCEIGTYVAAPPPPPPFYDEPRHIRQ